MISADLPVKMYCPISDIEETVYFHPVQLDGQWYIDINSFNGCDRNWHCCKECEVCKKEAYAKVFERDK